MENIKLSVWRLLNTKKYKSFKINIVQDLGKGDEDIDAKRLEIYETIFEKIRNNEGRFNNT